MYKINYRKKIQNLISNLKSYHLEFFDKLEKDFIMFSEISKDYSNTILILKML